MKKEKEGKFHNWVVWEAPMNTKLEGVASRIMEH